MPNRFLKLFKVDSDYELAIPDHFDDITSQSPALAVFTDFRAHQPATVFPDSPVTLAQRLLVNTHLSALAVVDQAQIVCGLITEAGLNEQAIMGKISQGRTRDELQVRDFWLPIDKVMAIDYKDLNRYSVGKIIDLLREERQPLMLVVDRDDHLVRGILSASEIARRLHRAVEIEMDSSFSDIFDAVMH